MCGRDEQAACGHLTTVPHKEDPHGSHDRKVSGRHHDPPVHDRDRPRRSSRTCVRASRRRAGPRRSRVDDPSQGVQLATMQALARYWADRVRLAQVRGEAEGATALHHRDRRAGHPLRPRPLQARGRAAARRRARMARLGHRAAEDHRPTHQSDGARRERVGRVPRRDPVDAGLRVLGQADHHRLGPGAHRARLGGADEAPGLRAATSRRAAIGAGIRSST